MGGHRSQDKALGEPLRACVCAESRCLVYIYIGMKHLLSGSKWAVSIIFSSLIFCLLRSLMNKMLVGTNPIWNIFMPVVRAYSKWAIWNLFPGNIPPKHQQIAKDHLTSLLRKTLDITWTSSKILGVYQTATLFCLPSSLLSVEKHNPLPPSIPMWFWYTCQLQCPLQRWHEAQALAIRALQSLDYNIRLSIRHLTLTQARTRTPPKKSPSLRFMRWKKQKNKCHLSFLGSCHVWILGTTGENVAKNTQKAAETSGCERKRQRKKRK